MVNRFNRFGLWSIIGRMIALHDSHDFGKMDHLHHWLVGVLLTSTAEVANLATTIMDFKRQAESREPAVCRRGRAAVVSRGHGKELGWGFWTGRF